MKRAIQSFFSVVIMLTIAAATFGLTACAAPSKKDTVFEHLTKNLGFSTAAACGIMANIERESNFDSTEVIIDSNGLPSGGLCQWNGSRFKSLKTYCNNNGYNYLSIEGQLSYLEHELKSGYYKHIYNYLKNVSNDASGAYDAAYYWCYYFEVPANRASKASARASIAKSSYWPKYSAKVSQNTLSKITLSSESNGETVDITSTVKLSWNNAGSSVKSYTVYIAKKTDGKYDWDNAEKAVLDASKRSYTVDLKKLGTGSFSAYVLAKNSSTSQKSSYVTFKSKCIQHNYSSKITTKATAEQNGERTYTCTKCSKTVVKSILASSSAPESLTLKKLKVTGPATENQVTITWSKVENASGYEIYKYVNDEWKKVTTVTSDVTEFSFIKFTAGKTYKIKVRAFADAADKTVYSSFVTLTAATAPKAVTISSVSRPEKKSAGLSWKSVSGASGYVVYMSTKLNGTYKKVAEYGSSTTKCTVKGLESGKTYYFKIKAYKETTANKAYSDFSNIKYVVAK